MALRLFNGRSNSEDGWWYVDQGSCTWLNVLGCNPPVQLQIQNGQPLQIMGAFAADFNYYIEPLRNPDSACWTPDNSVSTSNHPGGTAMDLNWLSHRFQISYDGYDADKIARVRELLDFYEGMIFWGQDWGLQGVGPFDCMHFQMGYDTWGSENVARVQDFINRKIRPDGWSTFRRGGVIPPADPPNDQVDVLVRATGISTLRAQQIMPTMLQGLDLAQCNTVNRVAMALAQWGHESGSFVYTEEIQSGDETFDRWKYKGRTWIQITWSTNYAGFSQWCYGRGLVPTSTYFVDNPKELADLKWAGIGPAWYWTVARPQINSLCDSQDLVAVTQAINGGQSGAPDRKTRYDRALALGDQLLALTTQSGDDDDMIPTDQWNNLYHALMDDVPSLSPLRHLGEGNVGSVLRLLRNMDGSVHIEVVKLLASLGHPDSVALLQEVANADPVQYPDRQNDAKIAQAILADLNPPTKTDAVQFVEAPVTPMRATLPAPVQKLVDSVEPQTAGQIIGELYDVLDKLRMADALPIESRAPLAALISVLQTKNGAQL